jgi:hypothetical protein
MSLLTIRHIAKYDDDREEDAATIKGPDVARRKRTSHNMMRTAFILGTAKVHTYQQAKI